MDNIGTALVTAAFAVIAYVIIDVATAIAKRARARARLYDAQTKATELEIDIRKRGGS